mgnify:CR=1 FL=1
MGAKQPPIWPSVRGLVWTAPAPDDGPLARAAGDEVVRRGVVQQRPEALEIAVRSDHAVAGRVAGRAGRAGRAARAGRALSLIHI